MPPENVQYWAFISHAALANILLNLPCSFFLFVSIQHRKFTLSVVCGIALQLLPVISVFACILEATYALLVSTDS